ncbi:MAG: hypothetical protein IAX21_04620 [Candidatus Bathyarchaeota archaeon]|nr:MAG: hypothetical protein IAX21_04620 [Candidatus Bathyarchaeota archaeon]
MIISSLMTVLFLSTCIPNAVFASSENWVEVMRFSENSSWLGETDPFIIDHVDWRIKWEYVPRPNEENLSVFQVYAETHEDFHKRVDSIVNWGSGIYNGTLNITDDFGKYKLFIISNVPSFSIIIEQNIDSIPEFPSWIVLPLFLIATLSLIAARKKLKLNS